MSPKISTTIDLAKLAPASTRPRDLLLACFHQAVARGLRVRDRGGYGAGIERDPETGQWVPGPDLTVDLAGAVALALQPDRRAPGREGEDPDIVMAARALDVHWWWMLGAIDGFANASTPTLEQGASRSDYRDGVRAGHLLYAAVTIDCPVCGTRRFPEWGSCDCARMRRPRE